MITAESFAAALTQISAEGSLSAEQVRAFAAKKGITSLIPRALRHMGRLAEKESLRFGIVVASEADKKAALDKSLALFGEGMRSAKISIDDTLVGGYIARTKGIQIDASYKKALLSVYRSAITH
jgi:F0F1-type ATP synthase delta subunit